jgi:transketolase
MSDSTGARPLTVAKNERDVQVSFTIVVRRPKSFLYIRRLAHGGAGRALRLGARRPLSAGRGFRQASIAIAAARGPEETRMPDIARMADAIRFLAIDAILNAGEGHQGVPLGMAEIAATLYARHLKADPADPLWPDRDRVVLSNGHGSMLLYALLHLSGYPHVTNEALRSFRKLGSVCAGHPEIEQHAGIEITTGLLGQGIACAVGMAVAEARLAGRFGSELVDHRTWAFVGDGCLQEGLGQEAISLAGHLRLGKLTFLWDDNRITDDGATDLSISEDVPARFRAANWHVEAVDGHDVEAVSAAIAAATADPRPSLIACRTTIAKGLPRLQGQRGGHSAPLTPQDAAEARAALGWPHPPFHVPQETLSDWRGALARGAEARAAWEARLAAHPEAAEFRRWTSGDLPADWPGVVARLAADAAARAQPRPTIASSGDVCDALAEALPETLVLCADLEAPTNHKRSRAAFTAENRAGAYVHCGVREHLMGAMADGIAAHGGLRPVNVTYLAFADYERPAMRMAALMGLPALFVFSHDSIGVGSNGPTHQPVEILASFRAMPNMRVFRPADAVETAEAWAIALEHRTGPTMLALSRQAATPARQATSGNRSRRGAYVLAEADGPRAATILATGTEVALAVEARRRLAAQGVAVAVVSMPCWELFDAQDADYRARVLGRAPRIAVEAALSFGWERWLREGDRFVGMTGFGASARAEALYEHFGITVDRIIEAARDAIASGGAR